jgi:segregation and condensation protein B
MARLEAVLFLAREPLGTRKLAQLAGLADGTEARTLVRALNRLYDEEGCAFRAVEVAGGFQLLSRAKFAPWLRRLDGSAAEVRLSGPAMETLAVVAYRQPVLRAEIEAIRGVQCGEVLRQLMERDLVRIVGRSEELGRPFLYGTTREFLQVFGLRHLDELPRPDGKPVSEQTDQPVHSIDTGGNPNVKTAIDSLAAREDAINTLAPASAVAKLGGLTPSADYASVLDAAEEEEEDDEFDDLDDDDESDDEDEDEEFEDEDLEEEEWEEVEDDEDLEEDVDEEEELEEEEEGEGEDWEDDEDWDDEEEDEEEEGEDWE